MVMMLVGCNTMVPVVPKFPEPPAILMSNCGPLSTIDKEVVLLNEFLQTVRGNYEKFHNCADLLLGWQTWYNEQQKIYGQK